MLFRCTHIHIPFCRTNTKTAANSPMAISAIVFVTTAATITAAAAAAAATTATSTTTTAGAAAAGLFAVSVTY
jgi:hypothetical protein